jgi:signal transduction histidine kinase
MSLFFKRLKRNLGDIVASASRIWPSMILLLAAFIVVVAASWHAQRTLDELTALTNERDLARTGRLHLEQTLSLFKDLEGGVRGFTITGQANYLDPYHHAIANLPRVYTRLKEVLDGGLPAGTEWADLDALMQERVNLLDYMIAERRIRGHRLAHDTALFDAGKAIMDRLRVYFRQIDTFQDERISLLEDAVTQSRQQATYWAMIALGLTLAFMVIAIYLLLRGYKLRLDLESQLRQANIDLDVKVTERTAALAEARDRIASFAAEQNRLIEAERRSLSREVHDQIGQVFTAIKLIAGSIRSEAFPPGQEAALAQALDMGIASTRRITAELRPPLLDDLGLTAALEHFAWSLSSQGVIDCTAAMRNTEQLDAHQALTLFRIVQEAVTNALRHAGADRVAITGQGDAAGYVLTITDNGCGFDQESVRPGALGLASMRERASLLGGECRIRSSPQKGCVVEVCLPLRNKVRDENSSG